MNKTPLIDSLKNVCRILDGSQPKDIPGAIMALDAIDKAPCVFVPAEYVEKMQAQLQALPDSQTDTESRLMAALDFLISGDNCRALCALERINADANKDETEGAAQ